MRRGRATTGLVTLVVLAGGCGLLDQDDPRDDAEAFAAALAAGTLAEVPFTPGSPERPQEWWDAIREGLGEAELETVVDSVTDPAEDRATATLTHTWTLPGEVAWTYDTSVDLVLTEDAWQVALEPGAVVDGLADGERLTLSTILPARGDIVGAGDRLVVTDRSVVRFGIDKTLVEPAQQQASARALARLLDLDADDLATRVEAAGEKAFVEALVLRVEDVAPQVGRGIEGIAGARGIADDIPLAPTRDFARAVLGTVGPVTAEMVEEDGYAVGDVAGLSGLQQRYDEQLRGTPGLLVEAVDAETAEARGLHEVPARDGKPLRTTLDIELQTRAEQALEDVGPASALVALRASSGELLAVASGPGSEGYSTATLGQYAPGSTFKVVSSLALLRAGMSPRDTVACTPSAVVDGKRFENYSDYPSGSLGRIPLSEAVAQSCNTAFVSQADRVDARAVTDAAAALGLGEDHDIGFPAYFGAVPSEGTATEHAAELIGQGRVLASPLAMAAVAGSVAAGRTVVPRLLAGDDVTAQPREPLTSAEAAALQDLMRGVVRQGSGAFLADVPGAPVLAKTGTAEFGDDEPLRTHAWMIAAQGDLAVAVFVEVGESGSRTAGPVLEEFLRGISG